MKNYVTQTNRLNFKTPESRIINYFQQRYKFSSVISESLTSDTLFFNTVFNNNQRLDGQIIYYGVSNQEPAGKPLKDCQYINLTLTLYEKNDADYKEKYGLKKLKLKVLKRICDEAILQGACLTHEDIARLLLVDRVTVSFYIKELERRNQYVQTRAHFTDQGRTFTHKEQIVKLLLMNLSQTEIAQRSNHNLSSVDRYIRDFLRISLLYEDGKSKAAIFQFTTSSPSLVQEYIALYQKLKTESDYKEALIKKLLFYRTELNSDLTNFNTSPFKKKIQQEVKI